MKEVSFDDLPLEIKKCFVKQKLDIILNIVEKAGLLLEFHDFIESSESFNMESIDELCKEFAKKYPEKFHILPSEEIYDKIFVSNADF